MTIRTKSIINRTLTLGAASVGMVLSSSALAETPCVDNCEPVSIISPSMGLHTSDTTPVFLGLATPGAVVEVTLGQEQGWVVANELGHWRWAPESALPEGDQRVEARVGDVVKSITVCVDTKAPSVAILSPLDGAIRSDTSLIARGQVEPGASLTLTVDGLAVPVIVDNFGQWLHVGGRPLADGDHGIMARAVDAAGNTAETVRGITGDGTAPAIRIMNPADGAIFNDAPDFLVGNGEPGARLNIAGPGVDLDITVPDSGMWRVAVPAAGEGTHRYTVEARDALGWTAEDAITIYVDNTAPGLAMTSSLDEGPVSAAIFRGMADPGAIVAVELNGTILGTDNVTADGRWQVDASGRIADGEYTARVIATDRARNVTSMEANFVIDTAAPALSVDRFVGMDLGEPVVISGKAEAGTSIDIRDEGDLIGMTTADLNGAWTVSLDNLEAGLHNLVITATDDAGNVTTANHSVEIFAPAVAGAGCNGGPLATALPMMFGLLSLVGLSLRRR